MLSAKYRPFCLCLNVLSGCTLYHPIFSTNITPAAVLFVCVLLLLIINHQAWLLVIMVTMVTVVVR